MGEPFRRGDKYGQDNSQAYVWMVSVVYKTRDNNLDTKDLFLSDIGVAPYASPDGTALFWNEENYTLAI